MRRRPTRNRVISKPDVTPLVDLTFLLLIAVMMTVPVMEYSLDITPPELNSQSIEEAKHQTINLDEHGNLYLGERQITKPELIEFIRQEYMKDNNLSVFIRADARRLYGEVMDIMRLVKHQGISRVSLVMLAEKERL